jgi:hypothetical protein
MSIYQYWTGTALTSFLLCTITHRSLGAGLPLSSSSRFSPALCVLFSCIGVSEKQQCCYDERYVRRSL